MKDKLEKAFHDALVNHEVNYDPKAWESLKKELPANKTPWYIIGSAAAILVTVLVAYSLMPSETSVHEPVIVQNEEQPKNDQPIKELKQSENQPKQTRNQVDTNENADLAPIQTTSKHRVTNENQVARNTESSHGNSPNKDLTDDVSNGAQENLNPRNQNNTTPIHASQNEIQETWSQEIAGIEITGLKPFYCSDAEIILNANHVPENTNVSWIIGKDDVIAGNEARFIAQENQEVRLIIEPKDKKHSMSIITKKINVIEAQKPVVEISSELVNTKNFVTLSNSNQEVEHALWRFENTVSKGQSTSAYLTSRGMHNYTVESYDKNGCFTSVTGQVEVKEDYNLFVENTFTPNNDGINDVFLPEALKLRSVNFKMSIFDKNGKLIYSTTDVFAPWDGTMNGQPAPQDTYVWSVSLINEEGAPEQYRGTIFLDRR